MKKIDETYEYDDVLIKPVPSNVSSRDNVNIHTKLSPHLTIDFPLIASPMPGVTDAHFAHLLSELGGIAILNRAYLSKESLFQDIEENLQGSDNYGISLKVGEDFEEYFSKLYPTPDIILIDTANGYTKALVNYVEKVSNYTTNHNIITTLMAGNVVTGDGCINLYNAGCTVIRVGIGGGSVCTTRNKTGISVPNISAIMDCGAYSPGRYTIVADGGIKDSGDLVKAFVAGANAGMSGRLFAQCFEAPNDGLLYGAASRTHMEKMKIPIKSVEGMDVSIEKKYSLADFVKEFGYGIKSAGTYLNARSIQEMYINGSFVKVSDRAIKKEIR